MLNRYVNKEEQVADWEVHKDECKALKKLSPTIPDAESRLVARILWKG